MRETFLQVSYYLSRISALLFVSSIVYRISLIPLYLRVYINDRENSVK